MKESERHTPITDLLLAQRTHNRILSIGTSAPRVDAYDKVTGRVEYASDYYGNNVVWAGVKRAGVPHARLKTIDSSRAEKHPGFICMLTHENVSGTNRQGVVKKDQPVLVDDKVRYCGDAIAHALGAARLGLP